MSTNPRIDYLREQALALPELPGSYQFYDREGTIIYVGKAKNLKSRVSSYFHKEVDRFKTKVLVSKIWDLKYTVVKTEEDALLLENSLIKQYNPRYNVLLKDGKTYPSICITREPLPRIFKTRRINKSIGTYYGPYSHVGTMYSLLDLIREMYQPRRCNTAMSAEGISEGRYKSCLEYHIHNCQAPCIGKQSVDDYKSSIEQAREILKGNTREVSRALYEQMQQAANELRFEDAEVFKKKYLLLENFVARSEVVSYTIDNVDVFTINDVTGETTAFVNYMHVRNGMICQSVTWEVKHPGGEDSAELLLSAIIDSRKRFKSTAKEIIVPCEIDWQLSDATFFVPQRGDKRKLLELSEMNVKQYRFDRLKHAEKLNPEQKHTRLLKELQTRLGLEKLPYHIECFDNSNIQGSDAVAGCVVFKGLKPCKKEYRKYTIRTVCGPDDYASMTEVVGRRYRRMVDEGSPLPDLIITDGGVGQMGVVHEVLQSLGLPIAVAGLAKDNKHRTNEFLIGSSNARGEWEVREVALKHGSELFHALTRIQDEVHRYAITFHRDRRSKHALHSALDDIPGIGPATKESLLKTFRSVKRIKEVDLQQLSEVIGKHKAQIVYTTLHPEK